jgi:hypothetical protein
MYSECFLVALVQGCSGIQYDSGQQDRRPHGVILLSVGSLDAVSPHNGGGLGSGRQERGR